MVVPRHAEEGLLKWESEAVFYGLPAFVDLKMGFLSLHYITNPNKFFSRKKKKKKKIGFIKVII
jgi:hypothetical protein